MSHRKVHSLGNVPFSWEEEPGVSKIVHQKRPTNIGLYALDLPLPPPSPSCHSYSPKVQGHDMKIPLPPCPAKPPQRSTSLKGLWRQEDPFLAAYMECTKSTVIVGKLGGESKSGVGSNIVRKSKFGFSCIDSCDVKDDNLVRLTHLPPLPRGRIRGLR